MDLKFYPMEFHDHIGQEQSILEKSFKHLSVLDAKVIVSVYHLFYQADIKAFMCGRIALRHFIITPLYA